MSSRWFALALVIAASGCIDDTLTAYAPDPIYHEEITACRENASCEQLCTKLFEVRADELAGCRITSVDDGGAYVEARLASTDFEDWGDEECWCDDDYYEDEDYYPEDDYPEDDHPEDYPEDDYPEDDDPEDEPPPEDEDPPMDYSYGSQSA
jgi:hypothetical protein